MVQLLEACREKVLVVLPERYLRAVVPNSSRSKGVKVLILIGVRTKREAFCIGVVGGGGICTASVSGGKCDGVPVKLLLFPPAYLFVPLALRRIGIVLCFVCIDLLLLLAGVVVLRVHACAIGHPLFAFPIVNCSSLLLAISAAPERCVGYECRRFRDREGMERAEHSVQVRYCKVSPCPLAP